MAAKQTTITLQVDPDFKKQVKILAKEDESNVSTIVRKAIKFYVSEKSPINKKSATQKAG